ncbi:MAG: holo-ACP synthase [Clostridiales bacterium]|nr:holo-ACP synthase [Clostridiales bacterium]
MIYGIGCDICEISRLESYAERFSKRYFSEREREMLQDRPSFCQSLAAGFAAKEAFSKALGTGIRGFKLTETEILRDELGKPYISLSGSAEEICCGLGITNIHLSLSHTKELAMAYVILEK